jgi:hypothetical protein
MPTPRYRSGQVDQTALPQQRVQSFASDEAFNTGRSSQRLGAAQDQATAQAFQIAEKAKSDADEVAFMGADSKAAELQLQVQNDVETNFRGQKAMEGIDHSHESWTKGVEDIRKGLNNDQQRLAFDRAVQNRYESLNKNVNVHAARERDTFDTESTNTAIKNYQNVALTNIHDPEQVDKSLGEIDAAYSGFLQRQKGIDPQSKEGQVERLSMISKTHVAGIERLLADGKDLDAKRYAEEREKQGQITQDDLVTIKGKLRSGTVYGEANRQADEFFKTGSEKKALEMARGIEDPDISREAVQQVKLRFAEQEDRTRKYKEDRYLQATNLADTYKDKAKIPMYNELPLPERNAIDARIEQLRSGTPAKTDINKWYELKSMASDPQSQDSFRKMNLLVMKPYLSESDFQTMADAQMELRKGKNSKTLDGWRTDNQVFEDAVAMAGIDPSAKPDTTAGKTLIQLRQNVERAVVSEQERLGRKLNNEELEKVTKKHVVKGKIKGSGFFGTGLFQTEKFVDEVKDGETLDTDMDGIPVSVQKIAGKTNYKLNVPEGRRNSIIQALRKAGLKTPSEQDIVRYYMENK